MNFGRVDWGYKGVVNGRAAATMSHLALLAATLAPRVSCEYRIPYIARLLQFYMEAVPEFQMITNGIRGLISCIEERGKSNYEGQSVSLTIDPSLTQSSKNYK